MVFAGASKPVNAGHTLASYNSSTQQWKPVSLSGGDFQYGFRSFGASISDPLSGLSFFAGGDDVDGLLKVDLSDTSNPSWTNQSTQSHSAESALTPVVGAGLTYLPIGKAGILLLIGGAEVRMRW